MRKDNNYRVIIEQINVEPEASQTIQFEFQDREDVFKAVENIRQGSGLEESTATKVAVALRLLGPEMVAHRKHALFVDFMPHFKTFMNNLKKTVKEAMQGN